MDVNQGAVERTMREHDVTLLVHGHTHRPAVHRFSLDGRPAARIVLHHDADARCRSEDKMYAVSGHIHVDPNPGSPDQETDFCTAIWNSGNPLPGYDLDECTERFRELLQHYLDTVLRPYVDADPAAWDWFPTAEEIASLSAEEALDAKKQAAEQRAVQAPPEVDA